MNDIAYDISHLYELESRQGVATRSRAVKTVPTAVAKLSPPGIVAGQDALARELLQSAPIHEALIEQYLRMKGDTFREAGGK